MSILPAALLAHPCGAMAILAGSLWVARACDARPIAAGFVALLRA